MDKLLKYFSFSGTATRSEFWGVLFITTALIFTVSFVFGFAVALQATLLGAASLVALVMVALASIWLCFATTARRCRDAGISPWWTLATIIPYVGTIVFIVLGCIKTDA